MNKNIMLIAFLATSINSAYLYSMESSSNAVTTVLKNDEPQKKSDSISGNKLTKLCNPNNCPQYQKNYTPESSITLASISKLLPDKTGDTWHQLKMCHSKQQLALPPHIISENDTPLSTCKNDWHFWDRNYRYLLHKKSWSMIQNYRHTLLDLQQPETKHKLCEAISFVMSPDGHYALFGSILKYSYSYSTPKTFRTVVLIDTQTNEKIHEFHDVNYMEWSPDGRHIVLGHSDHTVSTFDIETKEEEYALPGIIAAKRTINTFTYHLATSNAHKKATLYDIRTEKRIFDTETIEEAHLSGKQKYCLVISPSITKNQRDTTSYYDLDFGRNYERKLNKLELYNTQTLNDWDKSSVDQCKPVFTFEKMLSATLSGNEKYVIVKHPPCYYRKDNSDVSIVDIKAKKIIKTFQKVRNVHISPDGNRLLVNRDRKSAEIYRLTDPEFSQELKEAKTSVTPPQMRLIIALLKNNNQPRTISPRLRPLYQGMPNVVKQLFSNHV